MYLVAFSHLPGISIYFQPKRTPTVDGCEIHFAPPKNAWNELIPLQIPTKNGFPWTNKEWFQPWFQGGADSPQLRKVAPSAWPGSDPRRQPRLPGQEVSRQGESSPELLFQRLRFLLLRVCGFCLCCCLFLCWGGFRRRLQNGGC